MINATHSIALSIIEDSCFTPGNPSYVNRLPHVIETIHTQAVVRIMLLDGDQQSNLLPPGTRAESDTQRILLGAAMITDAALSILGVGAGVHERPTAPGTQPAPDAATRIDGVVL